MHDLLREYALECCRTGETEAEQAAALTRLLDWYVHTGHEAALLLNPSRRPLDLRASDHRAIPSGLADADSALRWFEAEHPVLLATMTQAANAGYYGHAWQIGWTLADYLDRQGLWRTSLAAHHAALAATRRLRHLDGQSRTIGNLIRLHLRLGEYTDALTHAREALRLHTMIGDTTGQALAHRSLAQVYEYQGDHTRALQHAQKALSLLATTSDQAAKAGALNSVGWYQANLAQHGPALDNCEQAHALYRELGDRHGEAAASDSLGYIHHQRREFTLAIGYYQRASSLFGAIGDRYKQGETLRRLGDAHDAAGNITAARAAWSESLYILDELGHHLADELRSRLERTAHL
jgi:tetratricopeptide (TPR) repeat protein